MSGSNAVIALIFAEYLNRLFWHSTRVEVSPDDIPQWAIKLTAIGAVAVITVICIATRKLSSRTAVVFTTAKVSSAFSFCILVQGISEFQGGQVTSLVRAGNVLQNR